MMMICDDSVNQSVPESVDYVGSDADSEAIIKKVSLRFLTCYRYRYRTDYELK